jgi:membrane fusion protein (multidrug efflux system)
MRVKHLVLSAAVISVALVALGGALTVAGKAEDRASAPAQPPPGITVEAVTAKTEAVAEEIVVIGTLASNESVIIRPEIAGRISKIGFAEGERVKKGQPLVALDASVQEAELKEAEAALNVSRRNSERAEELVRKGAGSVRQHDEALGALEADRARVALMQARLQKMTLIAPFDGVLGLRSVSVGAYVTPGQDIVNLENIDPVKVEFRVPETSLRIVSVGQKIRVQVDAFPNASFEGEVYAIDPRIDAAGRSVAIRARIPNPEGKLRPGLFARVALVTDQRQSVMAPETVIVPRGDEQFVYRVIDGKAVATKVKVGVRRNARVELREGVQPGDVIVTAGQLKLRDGAAVNVVPPRPSA